MMKPDSFLAPGWLAAALFLAGACADATEYYAADFDADAGGMFVGGTGPSWEHGMPTSGPGAAHSGTNCWATSLGGNYSNGEDGYITSPGIDLTAHPGGPFVFSWWQFLDSETRFDFASVEVSTDGGSSWQRVYGEASGPVASVWTREFVLLDADAAVANFRFRFRLRSDGNNTAAGFYIDTVRIFALTHQQVYFEDFEAGGAGYSVTGAPSTWEYGTPVTGPAGAASGDFAWGTSLDAFYTSNEDSGLVSAPINLSGHAGKAFFLSWRQFLSTESEFDLARVEVRPGSGLPWTTVYGPVGGLVSDTWTRKTVLLGPEFATADMQVRFALQADAFFESSGFYIDDVEVHTVEGGIVPSTSWPAPAPIAAGTPLDGTRLNATSPVPGSFSYSPAAGTALPAGTGQTLTATFTPDDLLTWSPVIIMVSIDVTGGSGSYTAWFPFPPGTPTDQTLPDADYDGDGETNFGEYGFVTDATSAASLGGVVFVEVSDGGSVYPGIEFSVRSDDPALVYRVWISGDLSAWGGAALAFDGAAWSLPGGQLVLASSQEIEPGIWRLRVRGIEPISAVARAFLRASVSY